MSETATLPVIDCDVHPLVKNPDDILGYMPAAWRRHFEVTGIRTYGRARDSYNHPHRTYRLDAVPASGGPAGSDRDYLIASHIEPYGIATALLLPQEPYGVTAWANIAASVAFCNAVNSYFLDNWVGYDERYALAVTVSAHDPDEAAREIRRQGQQPGVVGIQLLLLEQMMGSRWFDPIYEAACELSLPIVFHQSGSEGCHASGVVVATGEQRAAQQPGEQRDCLWHARRRDPDVIELADMSPDAGHAEAWIKMVTAATASSPSSRIPPLFWARAMRAPGTWRSPQRPRS